jgi:ribonuclease J
MIELARPRAFVPVHGTLNHLLRHAELARELGVPQVTVLENGDVATLDEQGVHKTGRARVGRVHVVAGRALPAQVIAERTALASLGAVHVAVPLDELGRLAGEIAVATRGVIDEEADGGLLEAARKHAHAALTELLGLGRERIEDDRIAETARLAVRRTLAKTLGFKPVTTASLVRVHR